MKQSEKCLLAVKCKKVGDPGQCNELCYPYVRFHGEKGNGGVQGVANIPKAYRRSLASNLPFKDDNPGAYKTVSIYAKKPDKMVDDNKGLYLFGIPNKTNPKGCGNGKTTAATAILNEYLIARVILDVKKERRIDDVPGLFVNASKFQNLFNSQFRGTKEMQEQATEKYYRFKKLMTRVPLLVLDDIGIRDATEAFRNEFHEVIDDRVNEEIPTIYTSNVPIYDLARILDERIASRIDGTTIPVGFKGEDKRKRGLE